MATMTTANANSHSSGCAARITMAIAVKRARSVMSQWTLQLLITDAAAAAIIANIVGNGGGVEIAIVVAVAIFAVTVAGITAKAAVMQLQLLLTVLRPYGKTTAKSEKGKKKVNKNSNQYLIKQTEWQQIFHIFKRKLILR